ncbi:CLUMA_CG001965, isoform E [Clunio marinus]|uniref:CLUMA_CG001965, isoform E n=2 Tax=Clunio marinus TaxID=568069 RepID=A0A1J1HJH2_9DIPT|nr:CLUMA_CG001965, isoform E [Clunio marinus]
MIGIENEQEILSCAQLEAQQELSKVVDSSAQGATVTDKKVIKRDNIVLGISDLKQKKVDAKFASANNKTVTKSAVIVEPEIISNSKKERVDNKIVINPVNTTIKVNNCEIVSQRPTSVTAAIFAQQNFSSKPEAIQKKTPTTIVNKSRAQSATAKIFRPNPQATATSVTKNIFAPRTKDMNKGFLMFSESEPGLTMLKDEPDDLTHLAPTAGDACIPLDEAAPFFSDMFDDFIIPDSYNELLTDELNSLDSSCSKTTHSSSSNDPFINYRDDSNDICHSPHLLSPGLSKSPDANSLPSLCSPGSLPEDELAFMTLNMDDDLDMSMRAPYISMSESSELPMLIAEDLMWGAQPNIKDAINVNNKKMELNLSSQECGDVERQQHDEQKPPMTVESSLASLLCNQLLQHHQHQQQQQIILNQHQPNVKIKVLNHDGNIKIVNPSTLINQQNQIHEEKTKASSTPSSPEAIEWTMDDLFLLRKQPPLKLNQIKVEDDADRIIVNISQVGERQPNQQHQSSEIVKSKEKMIVNHKRPSLSNDIISSKRVKGQQDVMTKANPQLIQQVITMNNQKNRGKNHHESFLSSWSSSQKDQQQQQQASNSVLMNLLVSGCDVSAGYYTCLPRPKVAKA